MDCMEKIGQIKADFMKNRKVLVAIGDETRQAIMLVLMGVSCTGIRVGEITEKTHLSRPAVSHHLKILRECGLIKLDKQGTKNYYKLNIGEEFQNLMALVNHIAEFKRALDSGMLTGFIGGKG